MRFRSLLPIVVGTCLLMLGGAQADTLFTDTFDAGAASNDINSQYSARQNGSQSPVSWVEWAPTFGAGGAHDHWTRISEDGRLVLGSNQNITNVHLNKNFVDNTGNINISLHASLPDSSDTGFDLIFGSTGSDIWWQGGNSFVEVSRTGAYRIGKNATDLKSGNISLADGSVTVSISIDTANFNGSSALVKVSLNGTEVYSGTWSDGFNGNIIGLDYVSGSSYTEATFDNLAVTQSPASVPLLSPAGGVYLSSQNVTVSTNSGASIVYTTDGSDPSTTNGTTVASGSTVTVDQTETIKAAAVVGGTLSRIVSSRYCIPTDILLSDTFDADADSNDINYLYDVRQTGSMAPMYWEEWGPTTGEGGTYDKATGVSADGKGILGANNAGNYIALHNGFAPNGKKVDVGVQGLLVPGSNTSLDLLFGSNGDNIFWQGGTSALIISASGTFSVWRGGTSIYTGSITIPSTPFNVEVQIDTAGYSGNPAEVTMWFNGSQIYDSVWNSGFTGGRVAFNYYTDIESHTQLDNLIVSESTSDIPTFTPAGGTILVPTTVTISGSSPTAQIIYTTDGSAPSLTNGTTIASGTSVLVSKSMTIKAAAIVNGSLSPANSATYTFGSPNQPAAIAYSDNVNVDGDVSEWSDSEWVPLDKVYDTQGTTADVLNADIPEAYYAARWGDNGNKLYAAVKVRDTSHYFTSQYVDWNMADDVEFYIHTTGTGPTYYRYTQADAQQYKVGIVSGTTDSVWTDIGGGNPIPTWANFNAVGKVVDQWIYYEVAINPFNHFSITDSSVVIPSALHSGEVIGFDAVVCGNNGSYTGMKSENAMIGKSDLYTNIGQHILVRNYSINDLKSATDGMGVAFTGIISAVFGDYFYIESSDRHSGICVYSPGDGLSTGKQVNVSGTIQTLATSERYIQATSVGDAIDATAITPLAMTNKTIGGGSFALQPGISGGQGLNNIGLLIKTTGKITGSDSSSFVIDDGSGVGVKVIGTVPSGAQYVVVTGISSCEKSGDAISRVIIATKIDTVTPAQ